MRPSSAGSLPVDRLSSSPPSLHHLHLHLLHLLLLHLLLVPPSLGIQAERAESHDEFSCEPIGLRMCQGLPYNTTFMPNLLNHYDQQTAALAMENHSPTGHRAAAATVAGLLRLPPSSASVCHSDVIT
ncbi:unnamed protein product [Boreogadus saida]